jgi:hypothetical protein
MSKIPGPAHPHRGREPLPWHEPKPAQEDPDAPQLDHLKPEFLLEEQGVRHTVVVGGQIRVRQARHAATHDPTSSVERRGIAKPAISSRISMRIEIPEGMTGELSRCWACRDSPTGRAARNRKSRRT